MLSVYTRHYSPCTHTDIYHRRCRCPKWIQGTLDDGRVIRQSANTRNWEKAELTARALEDAANPHKPGARAKVTIADAIQCFRDDEKSRHLSKDSSRKSAFFFETQLKTWAERQGFVYLDQLTAADLTKFRGQWGNGPQTTRRKHERLIAFSWFCARMDWIDKNPAILMKRVKADVKPTDYFTKEEFKAIVDATHAYGDWVGGHDFEHRRDRLRALVLLMRWSGLAINDAVTLERSCISADGNVFLYRAKTGVAVYVPLPPHVYQLLRLLPSENPRHIFWSGNGDPTTFKRGWTRSLARLFKLANMQKPEKPPKRGETLQDLASAGSVCCVKTLMWIRSDNRAITSLEGRSRAVSGLSVFGSERRAATTRPPRTPTFPGKTSISSPGFAALEGAEAAIPSNNNRMKTGTPHVDCYLRVFTNYLSPCLIH